MRSSTSSGGTARAPRPARGIGTGGSEMWAQPQSAAIRASSPPSDRHTMRAPASAAPIAASTVSSVPPEYDTAKHSVVSPVNEGAS